MAVDWEALYIERVIAADRVLPVVATAIGGFVAGYSIRESLGQDVFHIESTGSGTERSSPRNGLALSLF
ncbi:hypothetical protein [Rhodococcoides fascians]|uniref:hypothetical protein n=1 Tax=Rhodococcoides fascians TaxID=1828 RepID=UPI00050C218C|nr:hypothetical protein [Rhodococcus fascians]